MLPVLCAFVVPSFAPCAEASSPPLTAVSAILIDQPSSRVALSKTPHLKRAPASTVKILTAMVAMDHLPMNRIVTIPKFVQSVQPCKVPLHPGEKYYVRDLIRAALIVSANDAAEVLAVATAGSRAGFAEMMNQKARSIGARNSRFVRPSGLPAENQYSSAYDMAMIMKHAEQYPFLVATLKVKNTTIQSRSGRKIALKSHNRMLWNDSREVVGKTGFTRKARHCFLGHIDVRGRKVVVSVMGSKSRSTLWSDLKQLADFAFGFSLGAQRTTQKLVADSRSRRIQAALRQAGFNPGPIDGILGTRTVRALKSFQRAHGLDPDGVVGPLTLEKLNAYLQ